MTSNLPLLRGGVLAALLLVAAWLPGQLGVWVDAEGRTILSDSAEAPRPGAVRIEPEELALQWQGTLRGAPIPAAERETSAQGRFERTLRDARDDVIRGEIQRGLDELRRLHRANPGRPEPAWLIAQIELHRGRLESAQAAITSALATPAGMPDTWRASAEALRDRIEREIEHAAKLGPVGESPRAHTSDHFRVVYDHHFAGRDYGEAVLRLLERTRTQLASTTGRTLPRPLTVKLYTRAQYVKRHQGRFGFATVGFYDGEIHVVATRQPESRLAALLAHEYTHALFEAARGSHRPFFLNEGLAERAEERTKGRIRLVRGDWRKLVDAIRAEHWIPLRELVGGFAKLEGSRALLAYLESRAAVELIEREHVGAVGRWLERCSKGEPWELALVAETGWNTDALDAELRAEVASRFVDVESVRSAGEPAT